MTWIHLVDQHGNHIVMPTSPFWITYFQSSAVDGTAPIVAYLANGLVFIVTVAQFNAVVGALPAAIQVQVPS